MSCRGFTLVELLVTIAILAIIASIAMENMFEFRKLASDTTSVATLQQVASAQETYYADSVGKGVSGYASCLSSNCNNVLPGFTLGQDVDMSVSSDPNNNNNSYTAVAYSLKGSGKSKAYWWNSMTGGLCPIRSPRSSRSPC